MKNKISKNLFLAISASIKAGKKIMEIYNQDDYFVEFKDDKSPLTIADKLSNKVICDTLKSSKLPILSEEGSEVPFVRRLEWDIFWMIDPIDGTKEFINRNGEFTVNIALIKKNKPILGVVYAPFLNELYFSEQNFGSFKLDNICNEENLNFDLKIDLQKSIVPKIFTLVVSKSHMNQETQNYVNKKQIEYGNIKCKSFGSSLKICKVAEGYANCYPRFGPTMEWDTAAAHAIAKYAGCDVTNVNNNGLLLYNKENLLNPFFIVERKNN